MLHHLFRIWLKISNVQLSSNLYQYIWKPTGCRIPDAACMEIAPYCMDIDVTTFTYRYYNLNDKRMYKFAHISPTFWFRLLNHTPAETCRKLQAQEITQGS